MLIMQRNTASEKNANLSQIQTFFSLNPTHCTERWRKESQGIFHCYLNCDFCRPVANKKITTGTQTNIYGVDISFLQKIPIVNVRLGSKYTSQLPLIQDTNFFSLKPTHCTGRWRKENWGIFDSYLNCDFYHPVANKKNYNRNPVKHLRWRFSFLQKIPIANVRLGFKCTF